MKRIIKQSILLILAAAFMSIVLAGCSDQASKETISGDTAKPAYESAYSNYTFTSKEKLFEDTAFVVEKLGYDPHNSHYGVLSCTICHESAEDGSSAMFCTSCHVGFKLPDEGWSAYPISAFPTAGK